MFYRDNCITTIGSSSHLPVTRLRPVGFDDRCPLLKDHLCSVHAGKPASCALFPLGRYTDNGEVKYFVQPITCGGSKRQTVREWLSGFNIEAEDKIYARWGEMIMALREQMSALEESGDMDTVQLAHRVVLLMMFLEYNQKQDFLYQLEANFENTTLLLSDPAKLWPLPGERCNMNDIVKQIAGNMSLSGMELTEEDQGRILRLLDHPEEAEAMLQELIEKHRKEP